MKGKFSTTNNKYVHPIRSPIVMFRNDKPQMAKA